jgi:CRP/FNR family transcriptional regulator, cyclic AMP receptor protein
MSLLERFAGADGERLRLELLLTHSLVQGSGEIATKLLASAELVEYAPGRVLIEQGNSDNDLVVVLAGTVSILVNGQEVARRTAGQHVGEMAVVDPAALRSATVVAREESVVLRIPEAKFAVIAGEHPELWRRIASELGERLRQRNVFVRQRNPESRIFIGSSRESIAVADSIQAGLSRHPVHATVWTNGVFGPSDFTLEALERAAQESDFAILVLGPDDKIISRKRPHLAPRDNVILELGLFVGALGRRRVFLVLPRGLDLKLPTDMLGITPVMFDHASDPWTLHANLAPSVAELIGVISALGPR